MFQVFLSSNFVLWERDNISTTTNSSNVAMLLQITWCFRFYRHLVTVVIWTQQRLVLQIHSTSSHYFFVSSNFVLVLDSFCIHHIFFWGTRTTHTHRILLKRSRDVGELKFFVYMRHTTEWWLLIRRTSSAISVTQIFFRLWDAVMIFVFRRPRPAPQIEPTNFCSSCAYFQCTTFNTRAYHFKCNNRRHIYIPLIQSNAETSTSQIRTEIKITA